MILLFRQLSWLRQPDRSRRSAFLSASWFNGGDFGEIEREFVRWKSLHIHFDQAHKRTAEVRLGFAAPIDNDPHSGDNATTGLDDIDGFLHTSPAGYDVFNHHEFVVRGNLETATQDQFAFIFLDKNVAFA